jgi:hypothetical protein
MTTESAEASRGKPQAGRFSVARGLSRDGRTGDLASISHALGFVAAGVVPALAPVRLLLATAAIVVISFAGWVFDAAYLGLGGLAAPPPGVASRSAAPNEQPTIEAERVARRTASTFVAGTTVSPSLTPETPFSQLAALVDQAGREKLASAGDAERARSSYLADWDRAQAAIERARPRGPAEHLAEGIGGGVRRAVAGAVGTSPSELIGGAGDVVVGSASTVLRHTPVAGLLWILLLLSLGAALSAPLARLSAVELARAEKLGLGDALGWLGRHAWRAACVPLAPVAIAGGLLLISLLVGFLLRIPGLDLVGAALYGVSLAAATLAVILLSTMVLGLPLAVAAFAAGDGDSLDATVRSTAYLFRAPARALALGLCAIAAVTVALLVVGVAVAAVLALAATLASVAGGSAGAAAAADAPSLLRDAGRGFGEASARLAGLTNRPAGAIVDLWEAAYASLVLGFALSALAEVGTRVYVALRFVCDGEDASSLDGQPLGRAALTVRS